MELRVEAAGGRHRLVGPAAMSSWSTHSWSICLRATSAATRRAYAFDLLSFLRFCGETGLCLGSVVSTNVFDYLGWRQSPAAGQVAGGRSVAGPGDGTGNQEPADRGVADAVRVLGDLRSPVSQPVTRGPSRPSGGTAWGSARSPRRVAEA